MANSVSISGSKGGRKSGLPRLGDILFQQEAVSRADLEDAIESQVLYGGKLGTNLLETGAVDIAALAKCLSLQHKIPTFDAATTRNISPEVVSLMSAKVAQKCQAIPVKLDGRSLYVVFSDPGDMAAVDEVAFTTGKTIIPLVAPEVIVFVLLERLYDIKRDHRYATISLAPKKKIEQASSEEATKGFQHSEIKGLSFGADEELISEDQFDNLINAYTTKDDVVLDLLEEVDGSVALGAGQEAPAGPGSTLTQFNAQPAQVDQHVVPTAQTVSADGRVIVGIIRGSNSLRTAFR